MSETNGQSDQSKLDRIEASHVKLMTDYALFVAGQQRAWERHEAFVAEQDRAWERQKERDAVVDARMEKIDARIEKLVSGMGAFIAGRSGEGKA